MQSKMYCFNGIIFKKNIARFWALPAVYFIYLLLSYPVNLYAKLSQPYIDATSAQGKSELLNFIRQISSEAIEPVVVMIMAGIAVMAVFSYLYVSRTANMIHTFPVTRKQLFFTNCVSGFLFMIIPQLLTALIAWLVVVSAKVGGGECVAVWLLMTLGSSFFFFGLAVCTGMLTGQLLAVPLFYVVLNLVFYGVQQMINGVISLLGYGISTSNASVFTDALSPVMYMMNHAGYVMQDSTGLDGYSIYKTTGASSMIVYACIGICFLVLAWMLYRKKQMETAGDLLTIKWEKPVFRWLFSIGIAFSVAVIVSYMFSVNLTSASLNFWLFLVQVIVYSLVLFFVAEMLIEKSFRVFHKKILLEGIGCVVFSAVIIIAIEGDLFGFEKTIPAVSDISGIGTYSVSPVIWKDQDNEKELMSIHKMLIENKGELEKALTHAEYTDYIELRYFMKDGSVLYREYKLPETDAGNTVGDKIEEKYLELVNKPENIKKETLAENYQQLTLTGGSLDIYDADMNYSSKVVVGSTSQLKKLYAAILKDIDEGNLGQESAASDMEQTQDDYANCLSLELYSPIPVVPYTDQYYNQTTDYANNQINCNYTLNRNCTNTIEALIQLGVIRNEKELTSETDYNDYYGY